MSYHALQYAELVTVVDAQRWMRKYLAWKKRAAALGGHTASGEGGLQSDWEMTWRGRKYHAPNLGFALCDGSLFLAGRVKGTEARPDQLCKKCLRLLRVRGEA
jgi:hypothetical protein